MQLMTRDFVTPRLSVAQFLKQRFLVPSLIFRSSAAKSRLVIVGEGCVGLKGFNLNLKLRCLGN